MFKRAWLYWEWDEDRPNRKETDGVTLEEPYRGKYRQIQEIVWAPVEEVQR